MNGGIDYLMLLGNDFLIRQVSVAPPFFKG